MTFFCTYCVCDFASEEGLIAHLEESHVPRRDLDVVKIVCALCPFEVGSNAIREIARHSCQASHGSALLTFNWDSFIAHEEKRITQLVNEVIKGTEQQKPRGQKRNGSNYQGVLTPVSKDTSEEEMDYKEDWSFASRQGEGRKRKNRIQYAQIQSAIVGPLLDAAGARDSLTALMKTRIRNERAKIQCPDGDPEAVDSKGHRTWVKKCIRDNQVLDFELLNEAEKMSLFPPKVEPGDILLTQSDILKLKPDSYDMLINGEYDHIAIKRTDLARVFRGIFARLPPNFFGAISPTFMTSTFDRCPAPEGYAICAVFRCSVSGCPAKLCYRSSPESALSIHNVETDPTTTVRLGAFVSSSEQAFRGVHWTMFEPQHFTHIHVRDMNLYYSGRITNHPCFGDISIAEHRSKKHYNNS